MQVVDLFCIVFWKMSFPEGSLIFEGGNALSNVVSNIRKASTACFLNLSFIWSPYWSLSAFFKSVVNDFFAWPLWYSPIHSERTDFSQGMQLYSSNFCICWEHAQYRISPLVRLFDIKGTTTWPRVSFFHFMFISTCFTKMARTCFAEELERSFFAISTL